MARIARRDTYGIENIGGGISLRRRVVAGTVVPRHYEVDAEDVEERQGGFMRQRSALARATSRVAQTQPSEEDVPGAEAGHSTGPGTVAGVPKEPAAAPRPHAGTKGAS